ncbi:MAG: hypothetical protein ACM3L6_03545 [Deltaproteobacteria bacterium]
MMRPVIVAVMGLFLAAGGASAQSMLEYATMVSAEGAAGAAQGEKGKDKDKGSSHPGSLIGTTASRLYEKSMQTAAERGGALFGGLGQGREEHASAGPSDQVPSSALPSGAGAVQLSPAQASTGGEPVSGLAAVVLKNGTVVEGNIVEQASGYVRVDTEGVVVTFFRDEIDRIRPVEEKDAAPHS